MSEQFTSKFAGLIGKSIKAGGGTFVLSSSRLDRDYDTITPEALTSAATAQNKLLCLWQHKRDQPIGAWENLRVDGTKLLGELKLSSTNLGQMVQTLLDEEVPLSASIGFFGQGRFNDFGGITYTDIELLECSVVSVPANPDAVRIAKHFGVSLASLAEHTLVAKSGLAAPMSAITNARKLIARANLRGRKNGYSG